MRIADMEQEFIDADKYLQPPGEISLHQKELIKFLEERNFGKFKRYALTLTQKQMKKFL